MKIIQGGLSNPQVAELLQQHLDDMALHSPPTSVHALDLDALRVPEITFLTLWQADRLMGCGAMKELDAGNAELKSMRTATEFLRRGVARTLLEKLISLASEREYQHLWLETGSAEAFKPARLMYEKYGFIECEPFADYVPDPYSVFMTKALSTIK